MRSLYCCVSGFRAEVWVILEVEDVAPPLALLEFFLDQRKFMRFQLVVLARSRIGLFIYCVFENKIRS